MDGVQLGDYLQIYQMEVCMFDDFMVDEDAICEHYDDWDMELDEFSLTGVDDKDNVACKKDNDSHPDEQGKLLDEVDTLLLGSMTLGIAYVSARYNCQTKKKQLNIKPK